MDVLKRIKYLMNIYGWSEYKLASKAGLSETTIHNMFKRNNEPTLPTLKAICGAYNITLCQFFREKDDAIILTEEQIILLDRWGTLSESQRKILLELMSVI